LPDDLQRDRLQTLKSKRPRRCAGAFHFGLHGPIDDPAFAVDHFKRRHVEKDSAALVVLMRPDSADLGPAIFLLRSLRPYQLDAVGRLLSGCSGFLHVNEHLLSPFWLMVAQCNPALWRKRGVQTEATNRRRAQP